MQPVATNLFKVHSLLIPTSVLLLEPGQNNLKPQMRPCASSKIARGVHHPAKPSLPGIRDHPLWPLGCVCQYCSQPCFTIPDSLPSPWLLLSALSSWHACPSTFQSVFIWPGPPHFTREGSSQRTYPDGSSLLWMPVTHNIWCMKFFIMFWHSASYYNCFTSPQR